ncbi:MAG: FHA domain-containing protein [Propionibacteriales bacterium]|nr:FHA domain-containing protein [Propionibacteriales bacterium]
MSTCPSGHDSASDDYCDVCGLPIPATATAAAPDVEEVAQQPSRDAAPAEPAAAACPNCQASNPPNALFCEACGYDFTTGSMPRPITPSVLDLGVPADPDPDPAPEPAAAAPLAPPLKDSWVAEIWIDPDWYADQESTDPLPSAGVPVVVQLRTTSILVGRTSRSRGIHPDIDLVADNGISRRHCQLTTDGTRWWVEDLGSSNGTYLGSSIGRLPEDPIPAGEKREIGPDGRVYLGAWTRLVVRRATPGEF